MKTAVVTTTINVPEFLEDYCRDSVKFGRKGLCFVVVGDKKTPSEAEKYCDKLRAQFDFAVEYFSIERQQDYLRDLPELDDYLPYNSVQRRNVGMVYAFETGCDQILTVDDDNYLLDPNLLEAHLKVGTKTRFKSYASSTGWLNPCQFLEVTPAFAPYHRGFPMAKRFLDEKLIEGQSAGRLVANVGMWIGDPDVDAWIRMSLPLEATGWTPKENFALASGTWAPFNSQQTTLARDVLPAYFLNPNAGRYDDIWASYIVHRIANHFGDLVAYGAPVVSHRQKRSLGSLWNDIEDERMGTVLTDEFVALLRATVLTASTYEGCYAEIADAIELSLGRGSFSAIKEAFLQEYARGMRMWAETLARVSARSASTVNQ